MTERRTTIQAEAYVMPETLARMWGEEGRAARERTNCGGEPRPFSRVASQGVLERLAEAGRLRKLQLDAGREIRAYWRLWIAAHTPSVSALGARVYSSLPAEPASVRNLVGRYRTWKAEAEARVVRGDLTAYQLACDLCALDRAPRELRKLYRMDDTRALRIVQEELLRYGQLAGWQDIEREAA